MPAFKYQYIRNLDGIIRIISEAGKQLPDEPAPTLGPVVDAYLDSHGYLPGARFTIVMAYFAAHSLEDFLFALCPRGLPQREVEWLWNFTTADVDQ